MDIEIMEEDGMIVLKPSEEIHFDNYAEVESKLNELIEKGNKTITVDMENVSHLYSMTVGMFNNIATRLSETGGKFRLKNISSSVKKVLKATKLDKIIEIT
ncbi:MAG: STAS domain-containing protein [bacterium]